MTILRTSFDPFSQLVEPSDEEISALVGGTPIVSYRPEDIPFFNPDIESFAGDIAKVRCKKLLSLLRRKVPAAIQRELDTLSEQDINGLANTTSECVHVFFGASHERRVRLIILKRPSLVQTPVQYMKCITGIRDISTPIHPQISNYMNVQHEIAHILQFHRGLTIPQGPCEEYLAELDADRYAFDSLRKTLPSRQAARNIYGYIMERAFSSFHYLPPKYWLASPLQKLFFEGLPDSCIGPKDFYESWKIIAEIRLRCSVMASSSQNQDAVQNPGIAQRQIHYMLGISSEDLWHALKVWDKQIPDDISGSRDLGAAHLTTALAWAERMDKIRNSDEFRAHSISGDVYDSLRTISSIGNISEDTRREIDLILNAAYNFVPEIAGMHKDVNFNPTPSGRHYE